MSAVFPSNSDYKYSQGSAADSNANDLLKLTPTTINEALDQYAARRYKLVQALKEGNYIQDPDDKGELSTENITQILLNKLQTGQVSSEYTVDTTGQHKYFVQVKNAEDKTYEETISFSAGYYPDDFSVSAVLKYGDDTLSFANLSTSQIEGDIKKKGGDSIEIAPSDHEVDYYNKVTLDIVTDDSLAITYTPPQNATDTQSAINESLVISTSKSNGGFLTSNDHELNPYTLPAIDSESYEVDAGLYRVPNKISIIPTTGSSYNINEIKYESDYEFGEIPVSVKYTIGNGVLDRNGNHYGSIKYDQTVTLPLANTNIEDGEFSNDSELGAVVFQGTITKPGWVKATTFKISLGEGDYVKSLLNLSTTAEREKVDKDGNIMRDDEGNPLMESTSPAILAIDPAKEYTIQEVINAILKL